MVSGDSTISNLQLLMPTAALFGHELRGLMASWMVRLWLVAAALLAFLIIASSWQTTPSVLLVASMLLPFLVFPWFVPVFVLGISPVTGARLDWLADGILSRPVTRYEYLLASWGARVVVVLGVFFVVALPSIAVIATARRPVASDGQLTWYGVLAAVGVVSLVLVFLVTLAFLTGTLLRRPLLAIVILIFVWFPINVVLDTFFLEQFSPISLNRALPTLLQTTWRPADERPEAELSARELRELSRQASRFLSVLSGGDSPPPAAEKDGFYEQGDYEDFSLLSVVAGYGAPALVALGLTLLLFSWRDL